MKFRQILLFAFSSLLLFSCVSTKKFKAAQAAAQARLDSLSAEYAKLQGDLKNCNTQTADLTGQKNTLQGQVDDLNKQVAFLKDNNIRVNITESPAPYRCSDSSNPSNMADSLSP